MHALPPRRIKAAVSHPHPLVAIGAAHTLARDGWIEVSVWQEGVEQQVDVVITDHETALLLAARNAKPVPGNCRAKLAVIALTGREGEVRAALEAGVQGYLLSHCNTDELIACVRTISSGSRYLSEAAMQCVVASVSHERLTPRETTVLAHIAEGLGNKAIANRLSISVGTVKSHVVAILDKLSVANRTQAVTVASQRGLIWPHKVGAPAQASGEWLARMAESRAA